MNQNTWYRDGKAWVKEYGPRKTIRDTEDYRNISNVMQQFEKIEQKQRCLRVRFLDWLSDKLLSWSKRVHEMSVKIDSPCVIKLPEKK